mmetsp:Transcript_21767/g.34101  ORF Transcript_21767/g.34101 Transcript_21767/m.34101 type:complete len:169 (-) Transcript_21767:1385-1891(-)
MLDHMCQLGHHIRERENEHPFETGSMLSVIKTCGKPHQVLFPPLRFCFHHAAVSDLTVRQLKKGQELVQAKTADSLFLLKSGSVSIPPPLKALQFLLSWLSAQQLSRITTTFLYDSDQLRQRWESLHHQAGRRDVWSAAVFASHRVWPIQRYRQLPDRGFQPFFDCQE